MTQAAVSIVWLPTDPPRPCPELLTEDEAIIYLRLDKLGIKDPASLLKQYRGSGRLRSVRFSRKLFYSRHDLDLFIRQTQEDQGR